jgi:hypothetical protein
VIPTITLMSVETPSEDGKPIRHVVVFKYKMDAPKEKIRQAADAFRALQDKVPGIMSFEQGRHIRTENKDQGFTHVSVLTFKDAAAKDAYLPHPEHKAFGAFLGSLGILDGVFVVDFTPAP